jgi:hypothetical protein
MQSANAFSLDLFKQRLPARPYCSDNLSTEGLYRLSTEQALQHLLIQPNTLNRHVCLCFDVDREGAAIDWRERNLPPPNLSVKNPKNGHAHLIYLLTTPVPVSEVARIKPIQFMAAIQEGIRHALEADRGYAGLIVKNPAHKHWITNEWNSSAYELSELADWITLPTPAEMRKRVKSTDYAGLGRNCTVFEIARKQAYNLVREYWKPSGDKGFENAVLDLVLCSNTRDIGSPLSPKECRIIARSIARWTWKTFTPKGFRDIQSVRGKRKGAAKKAELLPKAVEMAEQGHTQRQIAEALGVSHMTVGNWLKSVLEKSHIR